MTPGLNVLLAASRTDHPHHPSAMSWLERAVDGCEDGGSIEILPMVAVGFLHLSTHRKILVSPTPIDVATEFIEALLAIPGVDIPDVGREWESLHHMAVSRQLSGNDITDAWIAACVHHLGLHLVTFDRGFSRLLSQRELTILKG